MSAGIKRTAAGNASSDPLHAATRCESLGSMYSHKHMASGSPKKVALFKCCSLNTYASKQTALYEPLIAQKHCLHRAQARLLQQVRHLWHTAVHDIHNLRHC